MKKNSKYYNNGVVNKMIAEGDPIPEGFVPGMVKRSKEQKEASDKKRKETCMKKYGGIAPLCSKEVKEKSIKTNVEKYGVENPMQSDDVQEKARQTNLKRYGSENPFKSKVLREKARQTNLERYGVENVFAAEEIKERIRQTNIERYGVEYAIMSDETQEKVKQTNLERYGTEFPNQSEEVKEKRRKTNLKRYGVENPWQSEEIFEKCKKTFMKKYGVENPMYSEEIKEHLRQTNREKYGVNYSFQSEETKEKVSKTCQEKYGVPWACMRPEARSGSNDSGPNKMFALLLEENGISYEREFHISRYSYDFKVGNILIEIDPYATHNVVWNPFGGEGLQEDYHQKKSLTAEEAGYRCIHVFDWDNPEKIIKSVLKTPYDVYARKCVVKEVSEDEMVYFENLYHLQGYCKGQEVRIGLYYEGELISLMTFGKPRYNKNYQWELLRYCSSWNVTGGAERLFKHFIKTYNPESIVSYCDRSKFTGEVYNRLGFELKSSSKPSRHWYSEKENRHITDSLLRQQGYDRLFNESYGKGTSNEELILERGYLPVYDCGQDTFVWSKSK